MFNRTLLTAQVKTVLYLILGVGKSQWEKQQMVTGHLIVSSIFISFKGHSMYPDSTFLRH